MKLTMLNFKIPIGKHIRKLEMEPVMKPRIRVSSIVFLINLIAVAGMSSAQDWSWSDIYSGGSSNGPIELAYFVESESTAALVEAALTKLNDAILASKDLFDPNFDVYVFLAASDAIVNQRINPKMLQFMEESQRSPFQSFDADQSDCFIFSVEYESGQNIQFAVADIDTPNPNSDLACFLGGFQSAIEMSVSPIDRDSTLAVIDTIILSLEE